ncbi:MAG TPA: MarR family transcriptional regulator [Solirubrobacterales bacterium]|nr:MarR family transcriptional regulator [Solirubrobacterales bacterium]
MSDLSTLLQDPLAHRALDALVRAEARVTRKLGRELERRGLSPTAFAMLVVVESAGGVLGLRALRQRLGLSKANASEVTSTLEQRRLIRRETDPRDRRALRITVTLAGRTLVEDLFPGHARRVQDTFTVLDDGEKRELTRICRKLERAA